MIINAAKIPESGLKIHAEEPGEILQLNTEDEFRPEGPVVYDLYVQVVDGLLIVRGCVSATVKSACSRCMQICSTTVRNSGFLRDFPAPQGTEEVDITDDLREAILLELPRAPLCSETCRGLCARCGKNLNDGDCGCMPPEDENPWGTLNKLKI
jgi:uncharacterized protein